ncbi:serine hydrolase [Streptomyces antimicrobicus]|uniref:Serine hydrolase n=1 Tax=Streptomyces antimicrobicus TaxID=2883108 RepID=A0ABS8B730_9ACTN|nr:serine hydrolase [Streptomyces antimicrobicus]MCB5180425.1 serine hydrolase [Streptomyces antimicrobicus]
MRTARMLGAAGLVVALAAGPATAAPSPPPAPRPQIGEDRLRTALDRLDGYVLDGMKRTGVPGVAVAVVHRDKVVHVKGFGVRQAGRPEKVDPDTVFQVASLSKPLASTVVAGALDRPEDWDRHRDLPGFALKDPWVSSHVTTADLFAHRSGLPDHAGDLLEDLGYDQAYILDRLRLEPLTPFRDSYAYTNFGLTAAAESVARAKGTSWAELSEAELFGPAGMTRTGTTYEDFTRRPDRAVLHVKAADGSWKPSPGRDPDAQAPAGGASSTVNDLARWMRLQLGEGVLDGKRVIAAAPLERTHVPAVVSQPPATATARTGFYGLGWNVSYDDAGRLRLSHSGAFALGANTNVTLLPLEELGIVVLTNAAPVGLADAIALDFFDTAEHGRPTADWLDLAASLYAQQEQAERSPTDYAHPPAGARPARADDAYTGTYTNPYYGRLTVARGPSGGLTLSLGPKPMTFPLTHYDGDTFSFETAGENAVGRTGVVFGRDGTVRVEYLDTDGLGTFTRV